MQNSPNRPRSPRKLRQSALTDMRNRAAEAAASLTAAQPDSDATSSLAARLLAHMEAASQRRKEALEMRKARSAAKQDLLLHRLVRGAAHRAGQGWHCMGPAVAVVCGEMVVWGGQLGSLQTCWAQKC